MASMSFSIRKWFLFFLQTCVRDTLSPISVALNFAQEDSEHASAVLNVDSKRQAAVEVCTAGVVTETYGTALMLFSVLIVHIAISKMCVLRKEKDKSYESYYALRLGCETRGYFNYMLVILVTLPFVTTNICQGICICWAYWISGFNYTAKLVSVSLESRGWTAGLQGCI